MITDYRINAKGELEGKVTPLAKWEEMYTKEEVIAMLTEIQSKITEKSYYDDLVELDDVNDIIQQKINEIKVESEDNE